VFKIPVVLTVAVLGPSLAVGAGAEDHGTSREVELGARPRYLVEDMDEGWLKRTLQQCLEDDARVTDFSIGHRGACLGFPEHTRESYEAAARMGAGIVECDVTFTRDRELVCRHSQCDLHTTTNILATPLARKCAQGFVPARHDDAGNLVSPASARCCTSDISLAEFKALEGRMDVVDASAVTVEGYLSATPEPVAGVPSGGPPSTGTLMTHAESIALLSSLGVKMTPELKAPSVDMPFDGFTQEAFAQKMIDEYEAAGVPAAEVFAQSFSLDDLLHWIEHEPRFGAQAVFLDGRVGVDPEDPGTWSPTMEQLADSGVRIIAPPLWVLLRSRDGRIEPSTYARRARAAGLDIITWTLERSGSLENGGGQYYRTVSDLVDNDGDMLTVLDVLAREVGIRGIFSDWPATVTFYASCMEHRHDRGRTP
jgi:glycerophosphoryl diester phosphodiesterase